MGALSDILMDRVWQLEKEIFGATPGFLFASIHRIVEPDDDRQPCCRSFSGRSLAFARISTGFRPPKSAAWPSMVIVSRGKSADLARIFSARTYPMVLPGTRFPALPHPPAQPPADRAARRPSRPFWLANFNSPPLAEFSARCSTGAMA